MIEHHRHASHRKVVSRLKRAEGHLRSVIAMIEEGRPCLDVAKQMQVVEGNIRNAKRSLINDNMAHYLDGDPDREELKTIFRYL